MKQLKFLMVALTLLMGISLTSCLGESDPIVTYPEFLRVVETYPYTFQNANGRKYIATNSSELMSQTSTMNYNDIVYVQYTYNSEEQNVTPETKEVKAKITFIYNASVSNRSAILEGNGAGEPYENATVTGMYSSEQGGLLYFDKNTLLLAIRYLAEKDLALHTFTLVYDSKANENAEDGIMHLYLRHLSNEEKTTQSVEGYYRVFDLKGFLAQYGETPNKIRIWYNETDKVGSNSLEDAKKELQYTEIDYKSVFENK